MKRLAGISALALLTAQTCPPALTGREVIPTTDFDVATALQPANIPPVQPVGENVGAFRFISGAGQLLYDDPIVFPFRKGASHLHQFYGNLCANANSTYESLRNTCGSTSNDYGDRTKAANRSAYWMPAMLDGKGNVVQPDYVSIYYKRWPKDSDLCRDTRRQLACVDLPNGLKFIMGRNMLRLDLPPTGNFHFICPGVQASTPSMDIALANCGPGRQFGAVVDAPNCWNGKDLDSPDHMSHVAYQVFDPRASIWKCGPDHSYRIPAFTLGAFYSVAAGDDRSLWTFSSDHMAPGQPRGSTYHADFFGAWDDSVAKIWQANCIDKRLNCSGGNLGNGQSLKGAGQPSYGQKHPNRLVPIPANI